MQLVIRAAALAAALTLPADDEMGWTGVLDEDAFAALHQLKDGAPPELRGEDVELGETTAYLSLPAAGPALGGVVVIHEWWGLNDHIKHWADRLAGDGYAALAVDLYGGEVAETREEAMEAMRAVDDEAALAILRAAHAFLEEDERVEAERTASVGWCFGGGWSLKLAIAEPELDAAVVYYGRLVTDVEALSGIEAQVLGVFGEQDTGIPPEAVAAFEEAMDEAGADLELHSYDAEHAFANPSSARYDGEHAAAAWGETRRFLCELLSPEPPRGSFHGGASLDPWVPDDWSDSGPRPMRAVSYDVGPDAECYVAALPGHAGGVEANFNRWRQQLGQDALTSSEIEALTTIPMLGQLVPTIRVEGEFTSMAGDVIPDALLLGAICVREDEVLFVKMIGPFGTVDDQAANFAAFCRGMK